MRLARTLLASLLLMVAPLTLARQISEGTYNQTWVSPVAGQCATCDVRVRRITPHIVELTASNGWSGYAYYVPGEDLYRGNFEWAVTRNEYARVVFAIELKFDGQLLTMSASSEPIKFVATYRKAVEPPREFNL